MTSEGRVIRVLNPYEVVINLGANDGVTHGSRFLVYALGDEIVDPETGEPLGRLEDVRGRGAAKHVQERFTTVRSSEKRSERRDRMREIPSSPMNQFLTGTQRIQVIAEEVEVEAPFAEVRVGDLVRRV